MNLLREIEDLKKLTGPLHMAIGFFDGVHLGHRAVIDPVLESSRSQGGDAVVVTFDPHPGEVLSAREAPRLLTSTFHKVRIFATNLGARNVLVLRFDHDFAGQTGQEFIESLVGAAESVGGIAGISVGKGWKFGSRRDGNLEMLTALGKKFGFRVSGVETVQVDGETVSSTRIREAVASGNFDLARRLLGREFTLLGTVVKGRKLGRTLGFPTANLAVESEQFPPAGVYAVRATGAGDSWEGVGNLGYRPTVEGAAEELLLEVHLFGLEHEIYGEEIEVEFVSYLRGEKKFDSVDALEEQIARDIENAHAIFSSKQG